MGHLNDVGESYIQHLKITIKVATRLACAAGCQLLHGFMPDVKPPFKNDINSLIDFLDSQRPEVRADGLSDEELYTNYGGD